MSTPQMSNPFLGGDPIEEEDLGAFMGEDSDGPSGFSLPKAQEPVEETEETEEVAEEQPETVESAPETAETEPETAETEAEPKDIRIPKARLDQEATRRRAAEAKARELEAQLARLQGQKPGEPPAAIKIDIGDKARTMFDKALDGDIDTANATFNEIINSIVQNTVEAVRNETMAKVPEAIQATLTSQTLQGVIDDLENNYEMFRTGAEQFNQDLVDDTLAMQEAFIKRGYDPAQAMRKAADTALKEHYPDLFTPKAPEPVAETPPAAPKATRSPKDVQRNVTAAQQQPPELPGRQPTGDADFAQLQSRLNELSDEELDALPEATLRRLRGDFL
jgi:hypothetical protein